MPRGMTGVMTVGRKPQFQGDGLRPLRRLRTNGLCGGSGVKGGRAAADPVGFRVKHDRFKSRWLVVSEISDDSRVVQRYLVDDPLLTFMVR